jgi:hypothetical protein
LDGRILTDIAACWTRRPARGRPASSHDLRSSAIGCSLRKVPPAHELNQNPPMAADDDDDY